MNLYVTLPRHKSFWSTVFSQGLVAVHATVALLLIGAAAAALFCYLAAIFALGAGPADNRDRE